MTPSGKPNQDLFIQEIFDDSMNARVRVAIFERDPDFDDCKSCIDILEFGLDPDARRLSHRITSWIALKFDEVPTFAVFGQHMPKDFELIVDFGKTTKLESKIQRIVHAALVAFNSVEKNHV